ncbi:hypothetical protein A4X03_0g9039, partial [Tilletia caries]
GGYSGQVVVTKSQSRFAADCLVHLDTGANLHAAGEANDPQVAFDTAFERVEKRLRRYKRKLKDHHAGEAQNPPIEIAYTVMDSVDEEHEELPEDYAPTIVAESTKKLRTMSVASAVMALDMTDEPVLLFRNPGIARSSIRGMKDIDMALADLLQQDAVVPALRVNSKKQLLQELAAKASKLTDIPEREIFDVILQRERLGSTGPVDLVFLLLAPEGAGADHLKALSRIARVLRDHDLVAKLRATESASAIYTFLNEEQASNAA